MEIYRRKQCNFNLEYNFKYPLMQQQKNLLSLKKTVIYIYHKQHEKLPHKRRKLISKYIHLNKYILKYLSKLPNFNFIWG